MVKNLLVLLLILFVFTCKEDNKKRIEKPNTTSTEVKEKVSKTLLIPNHPLWKHMNITLNKKNESFDIYEIFDLTRGTTTETSYLMVDNISVSKGSICKATIIVKKGDSSSLFGLRLMGAYPNRVDAVFNLNDGLQKDTKTTGGFSEGISKIEHIEDNWYRCTVEAKVNTSEVKIIFGPTSAASNILTWEANTNIQQNVLILPSSLIFEEITN